MESNAILRRGTDASSDRATRRHFDEQGLDYGAMWARVKDVITKTMMSVESKMNTLIKMHVPVRRCTFTPG